MFPYPPRMRTSILTQKRARTLRRTLSLPEGLLWRALQNSDLKGRFRRQHPTGPYILDFYSVAASLAVEIDGGSHAQADAIAHDRRRDAWLAEQAVRVLQFPASAVLDDQRRPGVLRVIREALAGTLGRQWEV